MFARIFMLFLLFPMATFAAGACNSYTPNAFKNLQAIARNSCEQTVAKKECKDLAAELKSKGEKPEDKMLSCQNADSMWRGFEEYANFQVGCATGGWNFVSDTVVGLGSMVVGAGQGIAKIVTDSKNENAINAVCDKDIKLKRALITEYNNLVPTLLKKDIPSDAILANASCAGIKSTLKGWKIQKNMELMGAIQRKMSSGNASQLTLQEKEFVAWGRGSMPPSVDLLALAKAKLNEMHVKLECYNTQARAAMICEAIASVATLAAGPAGIAIKAARAKNILEIAEFVGDTEKAAEAANVAQAVSSTAAQNMKLAAEASQKIKAGASQQDILSSVGQINDAVDGGKARLALSQDVLGRPLSQGEQDWILKAHNTAPDKTYRLTQGESPDELSVGDIKDKLQDRPSTVSKSDTRDLIENGVLGKSATDADPFLRLQAQKNITGGLEKGSSQTVADGWKAGQQYYKKLDPATLHADSRGANDIIEANTYGLKTKESADLFDKFLAANKADVQANYRSMVGSLTKDINRLQNLKTTDVEFNAYKIWREKELRYELTERYYTKKYGDKWGDIDMDKIHAREVAIRQQLYADIQQARAYAIKRGWPTSADVN